MDVAIYTTPKYTAYIYERYIVICTNYQCVRISFERYNMGYRLDTVKSAIINNEAETVTDIIHMSNNILRINACEKPLTLS